MEEGTVETPCENHEAVSQPDEGRQQREASPPPANDGGATQQDAAADALPAQEAAVAALVSDTPLAKRPLVAEQEQEPEPEPEQEAPAAKVQRTGASEQQQLPEVLAGAGAASGFPAAFPAEPAMAAMAGSQPAGSPPEYSLQRLPEPDLQVFPDMAEFGCPDGGTEMEKQAVADAREVYSRRVLSLANQGRAKSDMIVRAQTAQIKRTWDVQGILLCHSHARFVMA